MLKNIFAVLVIISATITLYSCGEGEAGKQQADLKGWNELVIDHSTVKDIDTTKYQLNEITQADVSARIMTDTLSKIKDWEVMVPGVRKFKVQDITSDSSLYTNFTMLFYKDKLVSLSFGTEGPLLDSLKAKYPNYDAALGKDKKNGTYMWHNGSTAALYIQNGKYSRYSIYNSETDMQILTLADKEKQKALQKKSTK